jgi:uncharacterized protein (DUF2225 family)/CRP-like cAMP-binding protein
LNSDIINLLRGIPLFSNLSPVYLTRLSEKAVSMKFAKGKDILEEGKSCNNLFITASGKMEAYKKIDAHTELVFEVISQGGVYGEAYVHDGSAIDATLRAAEPSVIVCIDRPTIISLLKENHEFAKSYMRQLGNLLRQSAAKEKGLLQILVDSAINVPDPYQIKSPGQKEPTGAAGYQEEGLSANEENYTETEGEDGVFFRKEYNCPLCKTRFGTLKPRQKYIITEKTDEDFCAYYKTVNPLYYEINVCPQCGYSFNNSTADKIKVEISDRLAKIIADIWGQENYCGARDLDDAIETFKLALECQRERGASDAAMGRLFLKLAWLYRYKKESERERGNLEKALYHLTKSYDSAPEDPKEEMNLMFLLGQLNRILSSDREAVNWFIRITQHPEKKSYPYIVNRARDAWQDIRHDMKS